MTLAARVDSILQGFGVHRNHYQRGRRIVRSPLTGETIAHVKDADSDSVAEAIERSKSSVPCVAIVPCTTAWRVRSDSRRGIALR